MAESGHMVKVGNRRIRRGRRDQVVAACNSCRKQKIKCDGMRPRCSNCRKKTAACEYETNTPTENRAQATRRKLVESERRTELHSALIGVMTSGAEEDAFVALHDLRHGTDASVILQNFTRPPSKRSVVTASPVPTPESGDAIALLEALSSKPDDESALILARLRVGEHWQTVFDSIRLGTNSPIEPKMRSNDVCDHRHYEFGYREVFSVDHHSHFTSEENGPWLPFMFDRGLFAKECFARRRSDDPSIHNKLYSSEQISPHDLPVGLNNHFFNLPLSSAILANNYPYDIQQAQLVNLAQPLWAMKPLNTSPDRTDPFSIAFEQLQAQVRQGVDVEYLIGPHPYVGALNSPATLQRAPLLSQVVASMTKSLYITDQAPTSKHYATMWLHWTIWKWLLHPSPTTYLEMPALVRPSSYQLFAVHARVLDFLYPPALRDYLCHEDNPNLQWLEEACITAETDWPRSIDEALCKNGLTAELDLSDIFKSHVGRAQSWSLGASVRPYLPQVDRYVRIRA